MYKMNSDFLPGKYACNVGIYMDIIDSFTSL